MLNREFLAWLMGYISGSLERKIYSLNTRRRGVILAHAKLCQEVCKDEITLFTECIVNFIQDPDKCTETNLKIWTRVEFGKLNNVLSNNEICYYCQGYFEISEDVFWNDTMIESVRILMENNESGLSFHLRKLYQTLSRVLEYKDRLELLDMTEWSKTLNGLFEHSIDKSYEGFQTDEQQKILKLIHDGVL